MTLINNSLNQLNQFTCYKSPLNIALKKGNRVNAQQIINDTISEGRKFNIAEEWQIKILQNEEFQADEFLNLDVELKIYFLEPPIISIIFQWLSFLGI